MARMNRQPSMGAAVVLAIIAVITLIFAIASYMHANDLKKRCTAKTIGIVTNEQRHYRHRRRGISRTEYTADIEYTVDEKTYIHSADARSSSFGSQELVYYDPYSPQESYISSDVRTAGRGFILPITFFVIALVEFIGARRNGGTGGSGLFSSGSGSGSNFDFNFSR